MSHNMRAVGVMDFAGGFACGVNQAGFDYVAKREPAAFGGFGVSAIEANFQGVQVEVTEPEFWSVVKSELLFGCPPCSGFSMLSTINTADSKTGKVGADGVRVSQRGVDSPDNKHMGDLISYAAKVKPEVAIFESVRSGGTMGAPLMRELWQRLRDESGVDYHMTDVFMNAALVGGDVIRPRYFFVAHQRPFGVDLPTARPRNLMDVIGDLPLQAFERKDDDVDLAWGHVTNGSSSDHRIRATIELFRTQGFDWPEGRRLPEHLKTWADEMGNGYPDWWYGKNGELLSHAVSDNMYSPFRWRAGQPMGVVTGGFLDRAVHPIAARPFTYREGARFMGLPDDWSLEPIVAGKKDSWLGKAIPVASGRWIGTWAKASIEGEPGEYAGVLLEPKHRVIDVGNVAKIKDIEKGSPENVWWARSDAPRTTYSYEPIGRGTGDHPTPLHEPVAAPRPRPARPLSAPRSHGETPRVATRRDVGPIVRVRPEVVSGLIEKLGLTRKQAADVLGVSPSRIGEITGTSRPGSWLNEDRWEDVQASLVGYATDLSVPA